MKKKMLALLLAGSMVLAMAACGNTDNGSTDNPGNTGSQENSGSTDDNSGSTDDGGDVQEDTAAYTGPDWEAIDAMDYDDASDALYDWNLGEFYEYYSTAKEELDDVDQRLALMALSEAKLLESGVFVPVFGDGGSYAMGRVVPRSGTTTSWGLDEYKFYTYLVTNELIKSEDRTELIALWGEAATAGDYFASAKAFLEENGYTLNDTYNLMNGYDLETWDVIATSYTSDSYFIACTYSGLLEYDALNEQQPALAESYEISDDGLTYTFHIRKGVNWVDQQGRVIGEVTADDWVASMQHVADNNDELGYLMTSSDGCGIKNYDAYILGDITDFSEVGVEAVDDYTLVYTLEQKFPAFITMMGYGCFAPLNRSFYESQGGKFGEEFDPSASSYNYGKTPANIAYCGPFLITNYTAQNVTSYKANPEYWNADAMNIQNMNIYYNDGSDTLRAYNEAVAGSVAAAAFNSSALVQARQDIPDGEEKSYFDLYHYTTTNSATTYSGWLNLNRAMFHNFNDETVGVSTQTPEIAARTRQAMNNQHFRLALAYGFDRAAFNSTMVGEELKYASLKNSYVTGNFAQLQNAVSVDINGQSTSFPAGTYYGVIMQAQLDADGYPIQVWDPAGDDGVGSGDGFDGWFNEANAQSELEKAVAELASIGVEISAENPIYIDVPYGAYSESITNRMNAYKQSIEKALGGKVIVNLVAYDDNLNYSYSYYRNSRGNEANFDSAPGTSGWGPDYGDPQTFLDTIQPYGYMTKNLGLY